MRSPALDLETANEGEGPDDEPTVVARGAGRFGRYRLCVEIASGGMATVFLARAEGPGGFEKLVALKRIHPHLAKDPRFVEMFLDEARIASRIAHPNVCSVFDFGEAGGTFYLAMEYLVGEPLSRVLRAIVRSPAVRRSARLNAFAARVVADACEGLHAAHELRDGSGMPLDVVHRDVSPHNVFLTYDGGVRIVDFGIASAADRVHHTSTGTVKGKYGYMAPEQLRAQKTDRRADIWSLGVVAWEMITLRRLFRRETEAETIFAVAEQPIAPPSSLRAGVPAELEAIVMRALSRDAGERYLTARDMGRDLTRFLARQHEPFGLADLADWMQTLFPDGQARRHQLLEIARQADSSVPQIHDGGAAGGERSGLTESLGPSDLRPAGSTNRRWSAAVLGAGALLVALGAAAAIGFFAARGGKDPTALSGAAVPAVPAAPARGTGGAPLSITSAPIATPGGAPQPPDPPADALPPAPGGATAPDPIAPAPDLPAGVLVVPPGDATARDPVTPTSAPPPAARRDRRDSPAATGQGVVDIVTPGGWAEVWWRGRRLAQTPARVTLPAGTQGLEIRPFGRAPGRTASVTVRSGATERISVRLP